MKDSNNQPETMSLDSPSTDSQFQPMSSPTSTHDSPLSHDSDDIPETRKFPRQKKGATSAGPTIRTERIARRSRSLEKANAMGFGANSNSSGTHRVSKKKRSGERSSNNKGNGNRRLKYEGAGISQGEEDSYDGGCGDGKTAV